MFSRGCPTAQTTQPGRWVPAQEESAVPPQNVQGMTFPNPKPRCCPITRPDAVRPEKLDYLFGETRAEPSPQDHHVPGHPQDRAPRGQEKRGDLRRRWESGFGTVLTEIIPHVCSKGTACSQSCGHRGNTTQAVSGMGGCGECLVSLYCQTAPNSAGRRKQAGTGALPRLSRQLLLTGCHSGRVHPHPGYL